MPAGAYIHIFTYAHAYETTKCNNQETKATNCKTLSFHLSISFVSFRFVRFDFHFLCTVTASGNMQATAGIDTFSIASPTVNNETSGKLDTNGSYDVCTFMSLVLVLFIVVLFCFVSI